MMKKKPDETDAAPNDSPRLMRSVPHLGDNGNE
jgi:hypothetical protein